MICTKLHLPKYQWTWCGNIFCWNCRRIGRLDRVGAERQWDSGFRRSLNVHFNEQNAPIRAQLRCSAVYTMYIYMSQVRRTCTWIVYIVTDTKVLISTTLFAAKGFATKRKDGGLGKYKYNTSSEQVLVASTSLGNISTILVATKCSCWQGG